MSPHTRAVLQALLVTFLWSTSWVLIKQGLQDLPALPFAGLRYMLAFLILLPFALRSGLPARLRHITRREWAGLIALGVLYYAVTQGTQYLGLAYLPAVTVSLLLNLTGPMVTLMGIALLAERPTGLQWAGLILFLLGVPIYFYPIALPVEQLLGVGIVLISVTANSLSAILGRAVNRQAHLPPLLVTVVSMGIGSVLLLGAGLAAEGLPHIEPRHWLNLGWLAAVNTAFAFTLWNRTLQVLSAMESTIINSTMLVQIALLAWLFLGESISTQQMLGLALAGLGAVLVQIKR